MPQPVGALGDSHGLSARAREYANSVIFEDEWPLTADHVTLDSVTYETSLRMERKHGVCISTGGDACTVRLSKKTENRAGFEAIEETIRHELVHVYQHQTEGVPVGHGASFKEWVNPLRLDGRCSQHYENEAAEFNYSFHCPNCGFIGGRYRMCKTVRAALDGLLHCEQCKSEGIVVRDAAGDILTDVSGT